MMKKAALALFVGLFAVVSACADAGDEVDTGTDFDVVQEDMAMDPDADGPVGDIPDVTPDGTDVEPEGELPPVHCSGSDTLRIEFKDFDENTVEGIPVALKCGDDQFEATSDSSGLVSFDNLDLAAIPVDFTYIHDNRARSFVGLGGARTVPDPLPIIVGEEEDPPTTQMRGDTVHNEEGSWVVITTDFAYRLTTEDRYEVRTGIGTDLPMSILEYTTTGPVATPIGYAFTRYDTPETGVDGPEANAPAYTFTNTSLRLDYDLRTGSPLSERLLSSDEDTYPNRLYTGVRIWGGDDQDNIWICGLTTQWATTETADTLHVAYAPAGLSEATDVYASVLLLDPSYMYYVNVQLPDDPSTWPEAIDVHDTPEIPGASTPVAIGFDEPITVDYPEWASTISYHIRSSSSAGVMGDPLYMWTVRTHPETGSFKFSDLPWPSTVEYSSVLMPVTTFIGIVGIAYDADPYEGYVLWTDDEWGTDHYLSVGVDSRFLFERP